MWGIISYFKSKEIRLKVVGFWLRLLRMIRRLPSGEATANLSFSVPEVTATLF